MGIPTSGTFIFFSPLALQFWGNRGWEFRLSTSHNYKCEHKCGLYSAP